MKQILFFLIGFCLSLICFGLCRADDCYDISEFTNTVTGAVANYETALEASTAAGNAHDAMLPYDGSISQVGSSSQTLTTGTLGYYYFWYRPSGSTTITYQYYTYGLYPICVPDSDSDGIPDGLDAYPDTNSAYQFRIMTNYFDSEGNFVAQLIVTSSGDYVLLGDLTADEIEAGVSAGTYKSDFVNSPIWIDSSDLEDDNASSIYASGDSTTTLTSTTASGLADAATTAEAGDLSTADGVSTGSTYDSSSDTDSTALGKIVDNTAASASNQQTLANYAKKQAELQATGNSLGLYQSVQLAAIKEAIEGLGDGSADEEQQEEYDEEIEGAENELKNLDVDTLLGEEITGDLVAGEEGDYQEHGAIADETWVQEMISSNPIATVLNNSGFKTSGGSATATLNLGELGSHTLDLSDLEDGFILFGNLLVSFTTLYGLIHVVTGRGF